MKYSMSLTILPPGNNEPYHHSDVVQVECLSALYKKLALSNKQICDLKNYGQTTWSDQHNAVHTLEIKHLN